MPEYYVNATSGDDNNSGLTPDAPFATLSKCNTVMLAGDRFRFRAGDTFDDTSLSVDVSNVVLLAYGGGAAPILAGNNARTPLAIDDCLNGVVRDIHFVNGTLGTDGGFYCVTARTGTIGGWLFADCEFDGGLYGARWDDVTDGTGNIFKNCRFHDQWEDGISNFGSSRFRATYCYFTGIGVGNTSGSAGDPLSVHETATFDADHCRFVNNKRGAFTNINTAGKSTFNHNYVYMATPSTSLCHQQDGGDVEINNCQLVAAGTAACGMVRSYATVAQNLNSVVRVFNTTFKMLMDSSSGFGVDCNRTGGSGTPTVEVRNCLFYAHFTNSHFLRAVPGTGLYTGDNNLYNGAASGRFLIPTSATFAGWQTAWTGQDLVSKVEDPRMVDNAGIESEDFALQELSPCRDAGADLSAEGVTLDFLDNPRVGAYDIGSNEYVNVGGGFPMQSRRGKAKGRKSSGKRAGGYGMIGHAMRGKGKRKK